MALGANAEEGERSLRDDLAASLAEIEAREAAANPDDEGMPAAQAEAETQAAEPNADRGDGRDAHGKFVKKAEAEADAETQPTAQPETPADSQQQSSEEKAQPASGIEDAPPKSWRADEAQAWKDLPAVAKAAISRREAEAARLAGANDAERMFGREFAEVVRPHMDTINQFGVSPQFAVRALLDNDRILRSGTQEQKLAKVQQLVQDYGIDLQALANAPQQDPNVAALNNKIAQLEARLNQPQQQQFAPLPPTQEEGIIMEEIKAFRADPAHPHFDAVHAQMGRLLETGAAPDLESAYQAAVAMTPGLRSTVPAPQPPAANLQKDTAAARRAAASVTGSPGQSGSPRPMSLRDELAEGLRSAGFSV